MATTVAELCVITRTKGCPQAMVEIVERRRFDDFDPKVPADERVVFSIGDSWYRIDLSAANKARLEEALAPFIEVAEPIPAPRGPLRGDNAASYSEIREWARSKGIDVPDRGRVKHSVVTDYYKAHR